jgi:hypothetical protein
LESGFERGQVVFFDAMLGREVSLGAGVYIFVHKDDIIAQVETAGWDVDWEAEALRSQGIH